MYFDFLIKFLRYGGGSVIALSVDWGVLAFMFDVVGVPYLVAVATGFIFGCFAKYAVSTYFVYEDNRNDGKALSILWFIAIALCGFAATHLIIYIGVEHLELNLYFSKFISSGCVFVMNFFLIGMIVFKDPIIPKRD